MEKQRNQRAGAPGWLSSRSVQLWVSAQGMIPGWVVGRSPQWVSHTAGRRLPFCLSLALCPSPACAPTLMLSLALSLSLSQINQSLKKRKRKQEQKLTLHDRFQKLLEIARGTKGDRPVLRSLCAPRARTVEPPTTLSLRRATGRRRAVSFHPRELLSQKFTQPVACCLSHD